MDIKIGVENITRELTCETSDDAATLKARLAAALAEGALLEITDVKGRELVIPAAKIAYIECGADAGPRVGFGI